VDIGSDVGAPTYITSAKAVEDGKPAPYCAVLGHVEPQIKFEVHLPLLGALDFYDYFRIPMPLSTDSMTAAAMTEPICPPAFAPIACIRR
jgi:hypothetical protein